MIGGLTVVDGERTPMPMTSIASAAAVQQLAGQNELREGDQREAAELANDLLRQNEHRESGHTPPAVALLEARPLVPAEAT